MRFYLEITILKNDLSPITVTLKSQPETTCKNDCLGQRNSGKCSQIKHTAVKCAH